MFVSSRKLGRRSFQFGLKTLLLTVTIVGLLAWSWLEFEFVRTRRAALRGNRVIVGYYVASPRNRAQNPHFGWPTIPIWRRWLGDTPVTSLSIVGIDPRSDEAHLLSQQFPEAFLCFQSSANSRSIEWTREPRSARRLSHFNSCALSLPLIPHACRRIVLLTSCSCNGGCVVSIMTGVVLEALVA